MLTQITDLKYFQVNCDLKHLKYSRGNTMMRAELPVKTFVKICTHACSHTQTYVQMNGCIHRFSGICRFRLSLHQDYHYIAKTLFKTKTECLSIMLTLSICWIASQSLPLLEKDNSLKITRGQLQNTCHNLYSQHTALGKTINIVSWNTIHNIHWPWGFDSSAYNRSKLPN